VIFDAMAARLRCLMRIIVVAKDGHGSPGTTPQRFIIGSHRTRHHNAGRSLLGKASAAPAQRISSATMRQKHSSICPLRADPRSVRAVVPLIVFLPVIESAIRRIVFTQQARLVHLRSNPAHLPLLTLLLRAVNVRLIAALIRKRDPPACPAVSKHQSGGSATNNTSQQKGEYQISGCSSRLSPPRQRRITAHRVFSQMISAMNVL
jgi:hypothetical protein